jgi:hypothetical protein
MLEQLLPTDLGQVVNSHTGRPNWYPSEPDKHAVSNIRATDEGRRGAFRSKEPNLPLERSQGTYSSRTRTFRRG